MLLTMHYVCCDDCNATAEPAFSRPDAYALAIAAGWTWYPLHSVHLCPACQLEKN